MNRLLIDSKLRRPPTLLGPVARTAAGSYPVGDETRFETVDTDHRCSDVGQVVVAVHRDVDLPQLADKDMPLRRMIFSALCAVLIGSGAQAARMVSIDAILHRPDARHGTFGPTGKRLFTERIEEGLGIRGQFCYIHHGDIRDPIRLTLLEHNEVLPMQIDGVDWYPSHLVVRSRTGRLSVAEHKFITYDDTFVDIIALVNTSDRRTSCALALTSSFARHADEKNRLVGSGEFYGVRAHGVISAPGFAPGPKEPRRLGRLIELDPGQSVTFTVAMAMHEDADVAARTAHKWTTRDDALERHRATYQAWFDENCPQFECDDPYITKMYWYRWFVARHCLSRAACGNLLHPYFFEGTHQSHFPRLIAFSSPHIISEVRWLRDWRYAFGQVRNHGLNADDEHKFFVSARINGKGGQYNNWIVKSAWEAFWVHPDRAWLEEVIDRLADDVLGTFARFDKDGDKLCAPKNHWTTGMEFQPAFFYFNDSFVQHFW